MIRAKKSTILIVDDVAENIDVLKGILGGRYLLKVATRGKQALAIAASPEPPDLILLDVVMPDLDGYEVCRQIKADQRSWNIPVVFVTSMHAVDDEARGFALGAADYIHKPISAPLVLARVATHLALYERNRDLETLVQERTAKLIARTQELESTRIEIIRRLGRAAEFRDNETGMHVVRLGQYVKVLAERLGQKSADAELLMYAAMMHDIGKIGIPDNILLKPGKLTPEEFAIIKTHPRIGADIIGEHTSALLKLSREVALTHHEKWDGSGYPEGLSGSAIPIAGRMTAIADIFDALISRRPYKEPWTADAAFAWIEQAAGSALDPALVELFLSVRPEIERIARAFGDEEATV